MKGDEVGQKVILRVSRGFSQSNKHDAFWHVVSTGYFYVSFLWAIVVSDFCHLEIYTNISLSLSTILFTVNRYADNHFYRYIYLFPILWSNEYVFQYYGVFFISCHYISAEYWPEHSFKLFLLRHSSAARHWLSTCRIPHLVVQMLMTTLKIGDTGDVGDWWLWQV